MKKYVMSALRAIAVFILLSITFNLTMKLLITFALNLISVMLTGFVAYVIAVIIPMPATSRSRFFEIVPLYPKRKYSLILYLFAGTLYTLMSLEGGSGILLYVLSVIIASQITKGVAKF